MPDNSKCYSWSYFRRFSTPLKAAVAVVLIVSFFSCGGEEKLSPSETFTWGGGQPISFSPPPSDWESSRYQNGGAEGVDYVKKESMGEQIIVAEHLFLGEYDNCANILDILAKIDEHDPVSFQSYIQRARPYNPRPFNDKEDRLIPQINKRLDRAVKAFRSDDRSSAKNELKKALDLAGKIRYTVGETVDRVIFTAEKNQVYPDLQVQEPFKSTLAGVPTVNVHFTFNGHGEPMVGRRIYLVKNNRMFVFGFQGLEENLPLFERILQTVLFPEGVCRHE
jgi:hypothetical protein